MNTTTRCACALSALALTPIALTACASREERIRARLESLPTPAEIIAQRDDDGDGRLTLAEFKDGAKRNAEERFTKADVDLDGYLTLEELEDYVDSVKLKYEH